MLLHTLHTVPFIPVHKLQESRQKPSRAASTSGPWHPMAWEVTSISSMRRLFTQDPSLVWRRWAVTTSGPERYWNWLVPEACSGFLNTFCSTCILLQSPLVGWFTLTKWVAWVGNGGFLKGLPTCEVLTTGMDRFIVLWSNGGISLLLEC